MVIMRRYALNILTVFLLLILTICDTALAEERQVYAAQGDVAFFKENDKIGLQSTDGTVLHAAEFDGTGYFDATGQANIYVDDKIGRIDRNAASKYLSTSTLKPGYGTERAVSNLQYMLRDLGFDPGTIDGIYGNNTANAVRNFQTQYKSEYNLDVDGQCGKYTKVAIWSELTQLPAECY